MNRMNNYYLFDKLLTNNLWKTWTSEWVMVGKGQHNKF
jgi:hypothetical protein